MIINNRIYMSVVTALASFAAFGEVSLVGTCPAEDSSSALRIVWHSDSPACELLFGPEGENMTLRYISPSGKVRDAVSVRRRQRYGCFGTRHHNPKTLEYMAVPKKNGECDLARVPTGGGD